MSRFGDRTRRNVGIVGLHGQGKTSYLEMEVLKAQRTAHPDEPIIILGESDEGYDDAKRIHTFRELGDAINTNGMYKFWPRTDTKESRNKMFQFLARYYRNGTLVIEDTTTYLHGNVPEPVRKWIIQHKNFGIDLFTTYHDLHMPPFVRKYVTHIVLFKNGSEMDNNPRKYREMYEKDIDKILSAWRKVEKAKVKKARVQHYEVITMYRGSISR